MAVTLRDVQDLQRHDPGSNCRRWVSGWPGVWLLWLLSNGNVDNEPIQSLVLLTWPVDPKGLFEVLAPKLLKKKYKNEYMSVPGPKLLPASSGSSGDVVNSAHVGLCLLSGMGPPSSSVTGGGGRSRADAEMHDSDRLRPRVLTSVCSTGTGTQTGADERGFTEQQLEMPRGGVPTHLGSHVADGVVSVTLHAVHLRVHGRPLVVLSPLQAGSLWVQITLFDRRTHTG